VYTSKFQKKEVKTQYCSKKLTFEPKLEDTVFLQTSAKSAKSKQNTVPGSNQSEWTFDKR